MSDYEVDHKVDSEVNHEVDREVDHKVIKLPFHEHMLLRPEMYIGSVRSEMQDVYIYEDGQIVEKEIEINPGLIQIFLETLSNAADNARKHDLVNILRKKINKLKSTNDDIKSLYLSAECRISVELFSNHFVVENYNKSFEIDIMKGYTDATKNTVPITIPFSCFTKPNVSSNFKDKFSSIGRNGYGAKTTVVYSKQTTVISVDIPKKRYYKAVFENNMTIIKQEIWPKPIIEKIGRAHV